MQQAVHGASPSATLITLPVSSWVWRGIGVCCQQEYAGQVSGVVGHEIDAGRGKIAGSYLEQTNDTHQKHRHLRRIEH